MTDRVCVYVCVCVTNNGFDAACGLRVTRDRFSYFSSVADNVTALQTVATVELRNTISSCVVLLVLDQSVFPVSPHLRYTMSRKRITLILAVLWPSIVQFLPRDAMLARYMRSLCVRLSVGLSHAGIIQKTAKRKITQTTTYDSPGSFLTQKNLGEIPTGSSKRERQIEMG